MRDYNEASRHSLLFSVSNRSCVNTEVNIALSHAL